MNFFSLHSLLNHLTFIYIFSFSLKVKSGSNAGGSDEALEITVYDYFVKHRNIELKSSAYMPCIDVGKPKRPNYLPLEVQNLSFVILFFSLKKLNHVFVCFL